MVLMCLAWELWFEMNTVSHIKKMINYTEKRVFISSSSTRVMPQIEEKQNYLKCRCLPLLALTMLCCTALCVCCPVVAFCWW